jgi:hypothetical protein
MMILPVRQIHLPLIEEGVFFVGPLDKIVFYKRTAFMILYPRLV